MDEFIIKEIFEMDEYSIDKMRLPKKATIIDVGAQIGCFTIKSATIAKKGKIFSFEPMESNFKLLERNVKTNNLNNVLFFHKGIANKKGKRKLYLCTDNTGGHSISTKRSKKYEIVDCISLRQAISENKIENIDLLKLDCEGAEYEILYSTPKSAFIKIM
ncbi:MAG: FkbM family methyltransferase, partial [Candidatus Diapherotrites archaeon]